MESVKVEVCRGTSCHLLGSQELVAALQALPAERRERIEVCMVDCLKSCRKGPSASIGGTVFSGLTPERLVAILEERSV